MSAFKEKLTRLVALRKVFTVNHCHIHIYLPEHQKVTSTGGAGVISSHGGGRRPKDGSSPPQHKKHTHVEEKDTNPAAIAAFPAYSSARVHFATFVPAQQITSARVSAGLDTVDPYAAEPSLCGSGTDVHAHMGDVSPQSFYP